MKEFIGAAAAAAAIGVHKATLLRAIERGDVRPDSVHLGSDRKPTSYGFTPETVRRWREDGYHPEMRRAP